MWQQQKTGKIEVVEKINGVPVWFRKWIRAQTQPGSAKKILLHP